MTVSLTVVMIKLNFSFHPKCLFQLRGRVRVNCSWICVQLCEVWQYLRVKFVTSIRINKFEHEFILKLEKLENTRQFWIPRNTISWNCPVQYYIVPVSNCATDSSSTPICFIFKFSSEQRMENLTQIKSSKRNGY